jgi:hypothetical protein
MGRKSCKLSLTYEGDRCEVFFVEGQVKHATYGDLVGDPAVFKVLRWTGGNFQLDFEGKTDKETTQLNTQGLLMEGLRLLDESQRDGGESEDAASANAASSATSSAVESNSSTSSFSDPFAAHPPGPPAAAPPRTAPSSVSSFTDPFASHPPGPPAANLNPATPNLGTPAAPALPRKKEEEEDVLLDN